jgi:hypothetical protein
MFGSSLILSLNHASTLPGIETEFKFGTTHSKLYVGLKHSEDGWKALLGFKIAGVKVKFPLYIVARANSTVSGETPTVEQECWNIAKVAGVFLLGSYVIRTLNDR